MVVVLGLPNGNNHGFRWIRASPLHLNLRAGKQEQGRQWDMIDRAERHPLSKIELHPAPLSVRLDHGQYHATS